MTYDPRITNEDDMTNERERTAAERKASKMLFGDAVTWIQTLGGRRLDLCAPRPEDVCFKTIATVLARVPRFGGHTESGVLSVAQHCVEGARAIRRDGHGELAAQAFLLHDAHEAYMGDMPTPVADALAAVAAEIGFWDKQVASIQQRNTDETHGASVIRDAIRSLKSRLDAAIYIAAGLPWSLPLDVAAVVHEYDLRMCRTERDARLATPPAEWADAIERAEPVKGCDLRPRDTWGDSYLNELLTIRTIADSVRRMEWRASSRGRCRSAIG